ncbi:hypothetical protein LC593_36900 [Nostoc sp. CHAB 5844]|nr:hypothetical protein [Nostoc sp. CHAB 5844]
MAHLDCESPETALESIANIYDAAPNEIRQFFSDFDIDEHYERNRPELPGNDEVRRILELHFGEPRNNVSRTYWFHLSRTELGAKFVSGIHPLNSALPNIWGLLIRVVRNTPHAERLAAMRVEGVQNFQYNFKALDPLHWGPYAMLVKEISSHASAASNHDYLKLPEIIEDICLGYEEQFGEDIQTTIENALTPTIVKFWTEESDHLYGLSSAIYYAYLSCRRLELSGLANTCFDGGGIAVPSERIVYVEQRNA